MIKAVTGLFLIWTGIATAMHGLILLAADQQPLLSLAKSLSGIVLACLSFALIEEAFQKSR